MAVRLGRESALELSTYRRIGVAPPQRGSLSGETCPDIFELDDGDFAVITRQTLAMARRDSPDA
ncbi:hypothetical protein [Streptomyces sp. NPDC018584]|uniref:hypothetical protein n=1 Tax=unclassified Streptomyces TaxID=2593676 RepID=UPI0037BBBDC5